MRLRFSFTMGRGRSGMWAAIEAKPEEGARVLRGHLDEVQANVPAPSSASKSWPKRRADLDGQPSSHRRPSTDPAVDNRRVPNARRVP
jgi:hypothetical protein